MAMTEGIEGMSDEERETSTDDIAGDDTIEAVGEAECNQRPGNQEPGASNEDNHLISEASRPYVSNQNPESPTFSQTGRPPSSSDNTTRPKRKSSNGKQGSKMPKCSKTIAPRPNSKPKWKVSKFINKYFSVDVEEILASHNMTALKYFKVYYSDELFDKIALHTNMYSMSKFGKELNTNAAEIKKVVWNAFNYGVLKVPSIADVLVFYIRNCLHVVDVNNPPRGRNRLWKVEPILNAEKHGCDQIPRLVAVPRRMQVK
ncbi:hypothetical protein J6590_089083 [Homalodisca vitripennis]|nr:hypothetical protein J6590_089083 [Homalodisca vitripennis]